MSSQLRCHIPSARSSSSSRSAPAARTRRAARRTAPARRRPAGPGPGRPGPCSGTHHIAVVSRSATRRVGRARSKSTSATGRPSRNTTFCGVTSQCATSSGGPGRAASSGGMSGTRPVPAEPGQLRRRVPAGGRVVQVAHQPADPGHDLVRAGPGLGRGAGDVAGHEVEHVPAAVVDAEEPRRAGEADPLQVAEVRGDERRLRLPRPAHGVADPHHPVGDVALRQRHLHPVSEGRHTPHPATRPGGCAGVPGWTFGRPRRYVSARRGEAEPQSRIRRSPRLSTFGFPGATSLLRVVKQRRSRAAAQGFGGRRGQAGRGPAVRSGQAPRRGPGPGTWVAVVAAILVVAGGLVTVARSVRPAARPTVARRHRPSRRPRPRAARRPPGPRPGSRSRSPVTCTSPSAPRPGSPRTPAPRSARPPPLCARPT